MAVKSQRRVILLFLYTNMAAMTSHANHQYLIVPGACLEKTEKFPVEFQTLQLGPLTHVIDDPAKIIQNGRRLWNRRQSTIINLIINFYSCFFEITWFAWQGYRRQEAVFANDQRKFSNLSFLLGGLIFFQECRTNF